MEWYYSTNKAIQIKMNQIMEQIMEQRTAELNKPSHTCGYCDEEECRPKLIRVADDIHSYEIYSDRCTGTLSWSCANCWEEMMEEHEDYPEYVEERNSESHELKIKWRELTQPVK